MAGSGLKKQASRLRSHFRRHSGATQEVAETPSTGQTSGWCGVWSLSPLCWDKCKTKQALDLCPRHDGTTYAQGCIATVKSVNPISLIKNTLCIFLVNMQYLPYTLPFISMLFIKKVPVVCTMCSVLMYYMLCPIPCCSPGQQILTLLTHLFLAPVAVLAWTCIATLCLQIYP